MFKAIAWLLFIGIPTIITYLAFFGLQPDNRNSPAYAVNPEDCGAPLFAADGNVKNLIICPSGRPNAQAIRHFEQMDLAVMKLPATAGPTDIEAAACEDWKSGRTTFPIEQSALELMEAAQVWRFGVPAADYAPQPDNLQDCLASDQG